MIAPIEINNKTKLDEQYRLEAKAQRRKVMENYPRVEPFQTPEESYDYLAQDRIDCLLCGRRLHTLAKHLASIHHMSADEYKTKYGLPYSRGLNSAGYREKISESQKERAAKEPRYMADLIAMRHSVGKSERPSHHRRMVNRQKVLAYGHPAIRWNRKAVEALIQQLETGESIRGVLGSSGHGFSEATKRYPDLRERYEAAIEKNHRERGFILKALEQARRHA